MPTDMRTDYDGPWKEILDVYFAAFLFLLFPKVAKQVDWKRKYRIRNSELQRIAPKSATGRQYVDKLIQVWLKDGTEQWILIHIEIQTWRDEELPRRVAHYRWALHLKYNVPIASHVVLADDDPEWTVNRYKTKCLGSRDEVYFPVSKLMDFADKIDELASNSNPFARFVLAHLVTRQTTQNPSDRFSWKSRIVQGLFDQKVTEEDVRSMFHFIDWLMVLPPVLSQNFNEDLRKSK